MGFRNLDVPSNWEKDFASRKLDNAGKRVEFSHTEKDMTIFVEGILNEDITDRDQDAIEFWGLLRDGNREAEGPKTFSIGGYGTTESAKEAALKWMSEKMQEYN